MVTVKVLASGFQRHLPFIPQKTCHGQSQIQKRVFQALFLNQQSEVTQLSLKLISDLEALLFFVSH